MGEQFQGVAGVQQAGSAVPFAAPARIAGYLLEQQVGAGGMAVVYRARDERLGRQVALKVLNPQFAGDVDFRRRFVQESRAATAVDHPNIVPVFEAGEADGVLFLAMRYVAGGDVKTLVRREGPMHAARAMALISQVASALDAGHAAGLVHRDVKPANMLLDHSTGRPDHVYLGDFGLSKALLSSRSLTNTGHFMGTADYCAPEQIAGQPVDGRADQYALACAAFELLSGAPPFPRDEPAAVIWAHMSVVAPTVRSRRPDLPEQADEVFARVLAKSPADRYATCQEFADALRRALGLAPYEASYGEGPHPVSTAPALADGGDTPASTARPAPTTPAHAVHARHAQHSAAHTHSAPPHAEPTRWQAVAARRKPSPRTLAIGGGAIAAIAGIVAAVLLANSPDPAGHAVTPPAKPGQAVVRPPGPGGQPVPVAESFHVQTTLAPPGSQPAVLSVAVSPDGKTAAAGDGNGSTYLWNIADGRAAGTLADASSQHSSVRSVAFSPDGKTLATADSAGSTHLWDVASGRPVATLHDPGARGVSSVAFSPDGRLLATGDLSGTTYVWEVAAGRRVAALPGSGAVTSVAFSPGGATLATAADMVRLWRVGPMRPVATVPISGAAGLSYSPAGMLAVADSNGLTYLLDGATGRKVTTLAGPQPAAAGLALSPVDDLLATAVGDDGVYMWDLGTRLPEGHLIRPDRSGHQHVDSIAFTRQGLTLIVGDSDGGVFVWRST